MTPTFFSLFSKDVIHLSEEAASRHAKAAAYPIEAAGMSYVTNALQAIRAQFYEPLMQAKQSAEADGASLEKARKILDDEGHEVTQYLQKAHSGKFFADAEAARAALHYIARIRESLDKHVREYKTLSKSSGT